MFLVSDLICHLVIRALWIRGLQLRPHGHRPRTGLSWRPTLTCVWEILIRHMTKQEGERGCHSLLMLIKGQLFIVLLIIVSDSQRARLNISDNLRESHWGRGGSQSEGGGAVKEERKESETDKTTVNPPNHAAQRGTRACEPRDDVPLEMVVSGSVPASAEVCERSWHPMCVKSEGKRLLKHVKVCNFSRIINQSSAVSHQSRPAPLETTVKVE